MDEQLVQTIRAQCAIVAASCANIQLRRATRAITHHYDKIMTPSGLEITQFSLLVAIAIAGPIAITTLARILVMDRTTLARNLKPLETRGLVNITPGEDRRVRIVKLSEKGYAALSRALPFWREAQTQIVAGFGQESLDRLYQDLSKMVELVFKP